MITQPELEELLALGHESRSLEVKGPGSLGNSHYVARVVRAVMAMGNLRDGGLVCLGVDDAQVAAMLPGLEAAQADEWMDYDRVSAALARYSDPPVAVELHRLTLSSGAEVVVVEVSEFDRDPHVCKRSYQGVLQDGQTYVRPRGQPRSVPIPSSAEGRELHEIAIDKGVREFVRRAGAAGIPLGPVPSPGDVERAVYDQEAQEAWAAETTVDRRAAAFSDVSVRPAPYEADRVSPGDLEAFATEHQVRLRGWPVPYVNDRNVLQRFGSWVGQDVEPAVVPHVEAWRLFTSGQFLHRRVLVTDLVDSPELTASDPDATGAVAVWEVLLYLVEVAELAARYATALDCEAITFKVALNGVAGRQLIAGDWRRELHGPYVLTADRLEFARTVGSARLLEEPRGVGVDLAQGLLGQFGLAIPDQVLFDWQEQVFNR